MSDKYIIPWCGNTDFIRYSHSCKNCQYGDADEDFAETGYGYCSYWDSHSPYDCPNCNGTGVIYCEGQCDRCNGTGELDTPTARKSHF